MSEDERNRKQLLKLARISFNLCFLILIATAATLIVSSLPSKKNEPLAEEKPIAKKTQVSYDVDSTEIKNGIHEPSGLIADTNFNIVLNTCTQCHSIAVVKQNRATKEGWKHMIRWMQKTQGLWDLGENEEPILNYLAKNYAPVNTGRRKNLENIVWYKLKN